MSSLAPVAPYGVGNNVETIHAAIALTTLPPQIRKIAPELAIDTSEEPFMEKKYGIITSSTFRTLLVSYSDHSQKILENPKLMSLLEKSECAGLPVPTEKLLSLKEGQKTEWIIVYGTSRIKMRVTPLQLQMHAKAPRLLENLPFELALKTR